MVGVIWYRFVRYSGTDWSDALVPIHPLQWYRFADIITLSLSCQLTPYLDKPFINRHLSPYIHLLAPGVQHMGASYLLSVDTKPKSLNPVFHT